MQCLQIAFPQNTSSVGPRGAATPTDFKDFTNILENLTAFNNDTEKVHESTYLHCHRTLYMCFESKCIDLLLTFTVTL